MVRQHKLTLEQLLEEYEADDGLGYREINYEDLELLESIGQGAFGTVYFGTWLGAEVAIKVLHTTTQLTDNVLDDFRREAAMMTKLGNHPNLVSFIGAVTKGEHFCIVTEFCAHGSLVDLLEKEKLSEAEIVTMALNIARGLYYCTRVMWSIATLPHAIAWSTMSSMSRCPTLVHAVSLPSRPRFRLPIRLAGLMSTTTRWR